MELVVHYRSNRECGPEVLKVAQRALEDFPKRPLTRFTPWFSNDLQNLPLKPKNHPPIISNEETRRIENYLAALEPKEQVQSYDCTEHLQEFFANLQKVGTVTQEADAEFFTETGLQHGATDWQSKSQRSWSITKCSRTEKSNTFTVSKALQMIQAKLQLHSFQRTKWVIDQSNCSNRKLEEHWAVLTNLLKYGNLPGCNAKIHRDLGQIWIFCDFQCCEHVGNQIKQTLNLTGKINLLVHRHGVIYKL
eukprot:gi/632949698/ref/XP_007890307.1/ PREDICTED: uncharacterized protein LOC103177788 [Callorhinchus milii]